MSIHNEAHQGAIAPTVLLPGDPERAKYIAESFLDNPVCYNHVRGMLGYTGTFRGKPVSVQGTGMGMPSLSIYVHELINEYKVRNLIRIGTCGAIQTDVKIKDLILAMGASTDSQLNKMRFDGLDYSPIADFGLLEKAVLLAREKQLPIKIGNILSSDTFYNDQPGEVVYKNWIEHGVMAVDMETSALYTLAARYGCKALTLLTVSDHILNGEKIASQERQTSLNQMIGLALELA